MNRTQYYDEQLLEIEHFQRHPQMIPFVGKYWTRHSKLLVVAESHYLPSDGDRHLSEDWYDITVDDLPTKTHRVYTSTANIVDGAGLKQRYKKKGHRLFLHIEQAILDSGFRPDDTDNMFRYIAFMNFFQRPAERTGNSISVKDHDRVIANDTLAAVAKVIQSKFIFFVSSLSWQFYDRSLFPRDVVGHSCHPTSQWWNRPSRKYTRPPGVKAITGKDSFIRFIQDRRVFS